MLAPATHLFSIRSLRYIQIPSKIKAQRRKTPIVRAQYLGLILKAASIAKAPPIGIKGDRVRQRSPKTVPIPA